MTAKEMMTRVHRAEQELLVLNAKKRHYEDLMMSIGANTGKAVIGKPSGVSKTETAAIGLVFLMDQIEAKIKEFTQIVVNAEAMIEKLPQDNFRKVLTLRYICDWSWKSIRDELGYKDEKSVYRCHGYALKELQKLM